MTALRPIWLVARREILTRARGRIYRVSTVLLVLLAVGGVAAGQVLDDLFEDDPLRIGVLPEAAALADPLREVAPGFGREVVVTSLPGGQGPATVFEENDLDAVVAEPDVVVFESETDSRIVSLVGRAAYEASLPERAGALGLTVEQARSLTEPVPVQAEVLTAPEGQRDIEDFGGIASLATMVLLFAISFYGNWVLVGVIEEKSNRVVEVLLTTMAPWQLLTGKVLGILALALAQVAVAAAALLIALAVIDEVALPEAGALAIAMAGAWLVLGLLLYNFIYAAVGATASRPEDSSSVSAPIMAPLFAGYFAGLFYVPLNPDAPLSVALSLFPITAPLTMPSRVVAGGGSPFEVALAMAGTIAAIGVTVWFGSRVYTGAILQTQRVTLLSAFRRGRE